MFLLRLAIFMDILDLREFIGHFKMSGRLGRWCIELHYGAIWMMNVDPVSSTIVQFEPIRTNTNNTKFLVIR